MPNTVLIGAQWGDEGKGKIIDVLAEEADIVVRYQGGNNAGHTVKFGDAKYILHLIPSGILHAGKVCVIGNGLVVDPISLLKEISELEKQQINIEGRLFISDRAHVVFPFHRELDAGRESGRGGQSKIGTTQRGIGPAYGDKACRVGIRMCDFVGSSLGTMLAGRIDETRETIRGLGGKPLDKDGILAEYSAAAKKLAPYVADTVTMLNKAVKEKKRILFEGAQGTMLDIDHGTYPFVTSSNATAGGACTGTGVPPHMIDRVIGVVKAYTTRVGEGPFPTELKDDIGNLLRTEGQEFGATTGRPRRCGWFDAVVARYAAMVNGVDYWAMTKLDVLDSLKTLKICAGYTCDGKQYDSMPARLEVLERCEPVYEEMKGWQMPTKDVTDYKDLPARAKKYVKRLCALTGVKLGILSVGAKRENTLRIAL